MAKMNKLLVIILIIVILLFVINVTKKEKATQLPSSLKTEEIKQNRLSSQENEAGNVTVTAKPEVLSVGEKPTFKLEFNTHSVDLTFAVSQISSLVDDKGNVMESPSWSGSPSGGHHRSGTLTFAYPLTKTRYVELIIFNVAGVKERRFKWNL